MREESGWFQVVKEMTLKEKSLVLRELMLVVSEEQFQEAIDNGMEKEMGSPKPRMHLVKV